MSCRDRITIGRHLPRNSSGRFLRAWTMFGNSRMGSRAPWWRRVVPVSGNDDHEAASTCPHRLLHIAHERPCRAFASSQESCWCSPPALESARYSGFRFALPSLNNTASSPRSMSLLTSSPGSNSASPRRRSPTTPSPPPPSTTSTPDATEKLAGVLYS